MPAPRKRALDTSNDDNSVKRPRIEANDADDSLPKDQTAAARPSTADGETHEETMDVADGGGAEGVQVLGKGKGKIVSQDTPTIPAKPKPKIRKLSAPRPFPTVPASVSATGPRSAHTEGKNYICITRKTPLGAYLRRCKDVIMKDGYKTLHLSAMGAAIPHLMQLALSLPPTLPYAADEIYTEILTGTVDVQDEVIPEDEDEDISYQTRGKSTVGVVIRVGDGVDEVIKRGKARGNGKGKGKQGGSAASGSAQQKEGNGNAEGRMVVIRDEDMDPSE